jgi:peptidoglycan/xylan/chitin deacetylase (PgdA/CDA1 family)
MNRRVTVVMYHYVRDLQRSRFPAIKGLSLDRFRRQLDHIQANYTPVRVEDVIAAVDSPRAELPPNAVLLTFDDGYSDHFTNVFPLLDARGIQGCFFPPVQAVVDHKVLDVNKIHFVLASIADPQALLEEVFSTLDEFRRQYALKTKQQYLAELPSTHRYDVAEVIQLKALLQHELPEAVRTEIVRRLFATHVTQDEQAFACELYVSEEQIACMRHHGMHIGSHGYSHAWLNRIPPAVQAVEIDRSLDFLAKFGVTRSNWTIGYPYGGFNESLLEIVRTRGCRVGFGVEARVADLNVENPLTIPRLDTNDLPS